MIQELSKGHFIGRFHAMASPCEIHIKSNSKKLAKKTLHIAVSETSRLEDKYSRYKKNNYWQQLHSDKHCLDDETHQLLLFSQQMFELSNGLFDITSGVLRKVWNFDIQDVDQNLLQKTLEVVGFQKIYFDKKQINIPKGMELDFGGIVKEYAVDKTASLLQEITREPFLINYGGDLFTNKCGDTPWNVGIEDGRTQNTSSKSLELKFGSIATSGNTKRFYQVNGKKYGHILNPKTGWPVEKAPLSVSVYAKTCLEAGFASTFAMLKGEFAEDFLTENDYKFWVQR